MPRRGVKVFPNSQFPSVLGMLLAAGLETVGLFRFQHTDTNLQNSTCTHTHPRPCSAELAPAADGGSTVGLGSYGGEATAMCCVLDGAH